MIALADDLNSPYWCREYVKSPQELERDDMASCVLESHNVSPRGPVSLSFSFNARAEASIYAPPNGCGSSLSPY